MDHSTYIREIDEIFYRVECTCGWISKFTHMIREEAVHECLDETDASLIGDP